MRNVYVALVLAAISVPMLAQRSAAPPRVLRPLVGAQTAEMAVKQAAEQLVNLKKIFDRDIAVLGHLRAADEALADPMQPTVAIQKAYEHVVAAKALNPEFLVLQGVIRSERELEGARRSPISADFGRLRSIIRDEALGPASRLAAGNALRLEEDALAWIKVQELISGHLRMLSEIAGESLRASQK